MKPWLVAWCVLALHACTTERMIGSTCDEGRCEAPANPTRIPCLISTGSVTMTDLPSSLGPICIDRGVHKDDDDLTACRMLVGTGADDISCDDFGFEVADVATPMSGSTCEMPQLSRNDRARRAIATGWYLDGPPLSTEDACLGVGAEQRVLTNGALPAVSLVSLQCAEAYADPASVSAALRTGESVLSVDPDGCSSLPPLPSRDPTDIGAVCTTRFAPPDGFVNDRTYVDMRSEQCETGVCLVDAASSTSAWACEACSVTAEEIEDFTYCSCRCRTDGDTSRAPCNCPSGYSCRTALGPEAPPSLAGGYCMREGSPPGPVIE